MRSQVRHMNPGKDQETTVVGNKPYVLSALWARPANKPITRTQVSRRRRSGQGRNGAVFAINQVFQMLAHRLGIAQIVILFHEPIEGRFGLRATDFDKP